MAMAHMPPLRVLCFGNSLTSGYHAWGTGSHPYSIVLGARLRDAFPGRRVEVTTSGVPGDVVCGPAFHERMSREWAKGSYDWTIILAGTNDIARASTSEEIFEAIGEAWDVPLQRGGKVLALTIPETKARPVWVINKRKDINESILSTELQNVYPFDLHAAIPYHSLPPDSRQKYWDDGLHLTPDGYDWMGDHIASRLISILRETEAPCPAPPKRTIRIPRGLKDDADIEEEAGDPKRLSKGYVFVRRRDLD